MWPAMLVFNPPSLLPPSLLHPPANIFYLHQNDLFWKGNSTETQPPISAHIFSPTCMLLGARLQKQGSSRSPPKACAWVQLQLLLGIISYSIWCINDIQKKTRWRVSLKFLSGSGRSFWGDNIMDDKTAGHFNPGHDQSHGCLTLAWSA